MSPRHATSRVPMRHPSMRHVASVTVGLRRTLARRPWVRRLAIAGLVVAIAASVLERTDRVERARAAWGETTTVLVATHPMRPGDPLRVDRRAVPAAIVPPAAITTAGDRPVRQFVGVGEIVTADDLAPRGGQLALVPDGWLAVPVIESPPSHASPGEAVRVVSDGMVVADEAVVVATIDDVTLVAVPEAVAPLLPVAGEAGRLTVLRVP